jgi:hypothetical protein
MASPKFYVALVYSDIYTKVRHTYKNRRSASVALRLLYSFLCCFTEIPEVTSDCSSQDILSAVLRCR